MASRAVEFGVAGIIVSNHGGRQLDTATAAVSHLDFDVTFMKYNVTICLDRRASRSGASCPGPVRGFRGWGRSKWNRCVKSVGVGGSGCVHREALDLGGDVEGEWAGRL